MRDDNSEKKCERTNWLSSVPLCSPFFLLFLSVMSLWTALSKSSAVYQMIKEQCNVITDVLLVSHGSLSMVSQLSECVRKAKDCI